jgi:hypothetical protein
VRGSLASLCQQIRKTCNVNDRSGRWPDDPEEKIRDASGIAKAVVEEFRDFLAEYHTRLVHPEMKIHGRGIAMEMPQAAADPQKVSEVHRLRMACDHFVNALAGQW